MIKYKLTCKDCDTSFDSWFASSGEYEKLKKMRHINCHECNSLKVEKSLMSPIHYNDIKKTKGIYGNATAEEVKELKEEGIETEIIPWVNDNEN